MKVLLYLILCSSAVLAFEDLKLTIPKEEIIKLRNDLQASYLRDSGTTAVINEFADKLFANLQKLIYNSSFDPMALAGFDQEFLGSELKFDNGQLNGISTIDRYGDVVVQYKTTEKILTVIVPIKFDQIKFTYDYLVRILFLPYSGGIVGKLNNFKMKYQFHLDFNTYHIKLQASDIMDSGHIDLTFTGNILDIVVNLISEFATTILHPFIVGIIQLTCDAVVNTVVDAINKVIDDIFHHNTTPATFILN